MSADKVPLRSAHETLSRIADKLSIERAGGDTMAPEPPPVAPVPPIPLVPTIPPGAISQKPIEPLPLVEPLAPAAAFAEPDTKTASPPPTTSPDPSQASPDAPQAPAPAGASAAPEPPAPVETHIPLTPPRTRPTARDLATTYFPMAIAVLSLILSLYQGFLFHESIDVMQRNVARGEYIRACREIIETYFVVKQRVGVLMPAADRSNVAGASRVTEANRLEAQASIAKFGGLGTYLANFQDAGTRAKYTELTRTLTGIMDSARTTQLTDIDKLFTPADKLFTQMNDDCTRLTRAMKM